MVVMYQLIRTFTCYTCENDNLPKFEQTRRWHMQNNPTPSKLHWIANSCMIALYHDLTQTLCADT